MSVFNLRLEPYIAEMWAYLDGATCTPQETNRRCLSATARLAAAVECSDEWLAAWARTASQAGPAISTNEARELLGVAVQELTLLVKTLADRCRVLKQDYCTSTEVRREVIK